MIGVPSAHQEEHLGHRSGWLRAAVLGGGDGLVSTSSLMVGVASADSAQPGAVLTAGLAGLAAGAMSMAAGEWVSVSSQSDVESADLTIERRQLAEDPAAEMEELARIYQERGLPRRLAEEVAAALTDAGALTAHARDELGINETTRARPGQAAAASAASFLAGGLLPFGGLLGSFNGAARITAIVMVTIVGLAATGALAARAAGTPPTRPVLRVVLGGAAAMSVTAFVGQIVGSTSL